MDAVTAGQDAEKEEEEDDGDAGKAPPFFCRAEPRPRPRDLAARPRLAKAAPRPRPVRVPTAIRPRTARGRFHFENGRFTPRGVSPGGRRSASVPVFNLKIDVLRPSSGADGAARDLAARSRRRFRPPRG